MISLPTWADDSAMATVPLREDLTRQVMETVEAMQSIGIMLAGRQALILKGPQQEVAERYAAVYDSTIQDVMRKTREALSKRTSQSGISLKEFKNLLQQVWPRSNFTQAGDFEKRRKLEAKVQNPTQGTMDRIDSITRNDVVNELAEVFSAFLAIQEHKVPEYKRMIDDHTNTRHEEYRRSLEQIDPEGKQRDMEISKLLTHYLDELHTLSMLESRQSPLYALAAAKCYGANFRRTGVVEGSIGKSRELLASLMGLEPAISADHARQMQAREQTMLWQLSQKLGVPLLLPPDQQNGRRIG